MSENNELNDIILNKGGSANSNKKIILAVATLSVILIIVLMLMNSLSSSNNENLPQAVLPPQPQTVTAPEAEEEPLFEEIEVIEEDDDANSDLTQIAQKLKKESLKEEAIVKETKVETTKAPVATKVAPVKQAPKKVASVQKAVTGNYYIQVGSFSKYEPNKKFLKSVTDLGFSYKYHKVVKNSKTLNKVLVGPFSTEKEAKNARRVLRVKVEPGAFLVKL